MFPHEVRSIGRSSVGSLKSIMFETQPYFFLSLSGIRANDKIIPVTGMFLLSFQQLHTLEKDLVSACDLLGVGAEYARVVGSEYTRYGSSGPLLLPQTFVG